MNVDMYGQTCAERPVWPSSRVLARHVMGAPPNKSLPDMSVWNVPGEEAEDKEIICT